MAKGSDQSGGSKPRQQSSQKRTQSGSPGQGSAQTGFELRQLLGWATQLSGISLELGVCLLLGYWGDRYWGTKPWLLILGGLLGFLVSMWHLWRIVQAINGPSDSSSGTSR
ncbi:MAG TPA: AtpZ/AtpI family protein [Planctomicrobium sp.]|nr:AtpZ/AtpI family protein [Planctomicrobium sp.]